MCYNFTFWSLNWSFYTLSFDFIGGLERWSRHVVLYCTQCRSKESIGFCCGFRLCVSWFACEVSLRNPLCCCVSLAKEVVKDCLCNSGKSSAVSVNSWWVNLIWELVLCLFLQPLLFLVWVKRNKCFILTVQIPCLVWIVRLALWDHVLGCTSQSFPLCITVLKY